MPHLPTIRTKTTWVSPACRLTRWRSSRWPSASRSATLPADRPRHPSPPRPHKTASRSCGHGRRRAWEELNCPVSAAATQQAAASPEVLAKAAEPLLAQLKTESQQISIPWRSSATSITTAKPIRRPSSTTKRLLSVQPDNADVRTDLGTAYWYTGNADKAIASFEKALAIRPNHPGTLFQSGNREMARQERSQGRDCGLGEVAANQSRLSAERPGTDVD